MEKVTPTTAPDFTEDERKFIEQHPFWRVTFMVLRLALMPMLLAGITTWFEYRSSHAEKKTDATYKAVAPAVNETQEAIKTLQKQVDLLQSLVVAVVQNGNSTKPSVAVVPAPAAVVAAVVAAVPSTNLVSRMDSVVKKIEVMRDSAKQHKDMISVNCVTEKLRRAYAVLSLARATDDEAKQKRFNSEINKTATEAEQCIGSEVAFKVPTKAMLMEQLEKNKGHKFAPRALPASANEAVQQVKQ